MSAPNNAMHPTANSVALIESLDGFEVKFAAGDAERYLQIIEYGFDFECARYG